MKTDTFRQDNRQEKIRLDIRLKNLHNKSGHILEQLPRNSDQSAPLETSKNNWTTYRNFGVCIVPGKVAPQVLSRLSYSVIAWILLQKSYIICPSTAPCEFLIFPLWATLYLPCTRQNERAQRGLDIEGDIRRFITAHIFSAIYFHHIISVFGSK